LFFKQGALRKKRHPSSFFSVGGYDFKEQSYYAGIKSSDICKDKKSNGKFTAIYSDGSTGEAKLLLFRKVEVHEDENCLIRFKLDQSKAVPCTFCVARAKHKVHGTIAWAL
tara:strand:+ start:787 stop:1119 length:333 start_codon:yes stop_codon:yes gene_type:complete